MIAKINRLVILALFISLMLLYVTSPTQAQSVGVGIHPGKISFDEPLAPGVHDVPPVTVTNTGGVAGYYEIEVIYFQGQDEMMPPVDWFEFSPEGPYYLEPDHSQAVAVTLEVPADADSGDYYAGIEAHPVITEGGVSIGIAAATKLCFIVDSESSFFEENAVAFYIALGVLGLITAIFFFLRFSNIRIRLDSR